jgi:NAD(P)H-hydrate epimerase
MPKVLISLTAPKPCVKYFHGRHFLGGRFLGKKVAEMFEIDVPPYERDQQIIEVGDNDTSGGKL